MSIVSMYQEHYKCSLATSLLPFSADVNDMPEGSSGRSSPHIASVPSSQRAGGSSSHGESSKIFNSFFFLQLEGHTFLHSLVVHAVPHFNLSVQAKVVYKAYL